MCLLRFISRPPPPCCNHPSESRLQTGLSSKWQQENTAVLGGSGDTCDSEEWGQAEQGRGLLVGCGTVGDALLYDRQAVWAQAHWETQESGWSDVSCSLQKSCCANNEADDITHPVLHRPDNSTCKNTFHYNLIITHVNANVIIWISF